MASIVDKRESVRYNLMNNLITISHRVRPTSATDDPQAHRGDGYLAKCISHNRLTSNRSGNGNVKRGNYGKLSLYLRETIPLTLEFSYIDVTLCIWKGGGGWIRVNRNFERVFLWRWNMRRVQLISRTSYAMSREHYVIKPFVIVINCIFTCSVVSCDCDQGIQEEDEAQEASGDSGGTMGWVIYCFKYKTVLIVFSGSAIYSECLLELFKWELKMKIFAENFIKAHALEDFLFFRNCINIALDIYLEI